MKKKVIANFTDAFISCSLNPQTVHANQEKGRKIVEIIQEVNCHNCTIPCKKFGEKCKYGFPRYPLKETLVIDKNESTSSSNKINEISDENDELVMILRNVEELLKDPETVEMIMNQYEKGKTLKEYQENRSKRIDLLLKLSGDFSYGQYIKAIKKAKIHGSTVLLQRDVDETMVNNYNPEWALAWNANHDIQPVISYHALITYVTDYWAKPDEGTTEQLKEAAVALKSEPNQKKRCQEMANTFITHRQMSESEAYYKIFPNMNLKYSSIDTIFIPSDKKELRSRFLRKLDEDDINLKYGTEVKGGRDGLFLEKPDIVDKYCRREIPDTAPGLKYMSLLQFAKNYQPITSKKKVIDFEEMDNPDDDAYTEHNDDNKQSDIPWKDQEERVADYFVTTNSKYNTEPLPKFIKLSNCQPGEIYLWEKRKVPKAARMHKKRPDTDPHRYFLSELLLYHGFTNEDELGSNDFEKCRQIYLENQEGIKDVKSHLMPYINDVEEARFFTNEAIQDTHERINIGNILDPEQEQENIECQGPYDTHPDFLQINPDDLDIGKEVEQARQSFRKIELKSSKERLANARKLDEYQKLALEKAVEYAQNVLIARRTNTALPEAPMILIHGGAGSGKSTLIDSIFQILHHLFQKEGDDPDCPYILLSAFTGTAAANIKGQTLHTLFSFNFGANYISLSDKLRNEKRNQLKNLRMLIIDEISLVDADMLYKIDLRLREITQKNVPFGNIAIIALGDLMQMSPISGRFIFKEPRDPQFTLSHDVDPLWQSFQCINLEKNHRQGEDKDYAEMLNRIRVGEETIEDIQKLKDRVRDENHDDIIKENDALYIFGTNKNVNKMNKKCLKPIQETEHINEAICLHKPIKNFSPAMGKAGEVIYKPFQKNYT